MKRNIKAIIRFSVLITSSFLCFGPFYLYDVIVSLQPILIGTSCGDLNSSQPVSKNCCESCLGFNPLEYNVLVGLPLTVSAITSMFSGFIIDRYGYCVFCFISSLLIIIGAVVRALGVIPEMSHSSSYALMLIGGMIIDNVFTILYLIKLYVIGRWFSGRYLSLVVGLTFAISLSGSVVAYYVNPILVESIGLENTLWCAIPIAASAVVAAILLWVAERMTAGQDYGRVDQTQPSTLSFATIKELNCRYWLVSFIIAISWLIFYAFIGNSVAFQTDIYQLEYETASFSSGVMYITKIIFSPIAGVVASSLDIHGPVAVFGCICNLGGLTMLAMAAGPPIVIIILMGLGFAIVYTVMAAVLTELVSFDKLASANGIMNGLLCLAIGAGDITVGAIAQSQADRVRGWLQSGVFLLVIAIIETLLVLILFVVDARSSNRVMCWSNHSYKRFDNEMTGGERQPLKQHERGMSETSFGALVSTSYRYR